MIKFTDAYYIVQKIITRNNLIAEVFALHNELLENEIFIKNDMKEFYKRQYERVIIINNISRLQLAEFSIERHLQINEIMRELRLYTDTAEVSIIKEKNRYIKDLLNQKYMEIECIQSQIPDRGVATNYILYTYDPQERCGESII